MPSHPSFGDTVRIKSTPATIAAGCAGLAGQVYGETKPSVTGVQVVADVSADLALNVKLDGRDDALWFAPDLVEFVDHAPGTEIRIGNKRLIRSEHGEWIDPDVSEQRRSWLSRLFRAR